MDSVGLPGRPMHRNPNDLDLDSDICFSPPPNPQSFEIAQSLSQKYNQGPPSDLPKPPPSQLNYHQPPELYSSNSTAANIRTHASTVSSIGPSASERPPQEFPQYNNCKEPPQKQKTGGVGFAGVMPEDDDDYDHQIIIGLQFIIGDFIRDSQSFAAGVPTSN